MPWFKMVEMKVTQVICREYEHSLVLLLNVNFHFFTWASCWYCDLISSPVPIRGRKKALFKTCVKQKNIGIFLRYVCKLMIRLFLIRSQKQYVKMPEEDIVKLGLYYIWKKEISNTSKLRKNSELRVRI